MFGFLKKKLKDAVSKFTKKTQDEVVEEKVEETATIEEAKQEEEKLLEVASEPIEDITQEVEELVSKPIEEKKVKVEKTILKETPKDEKPARSVQEKEPRVSIDKKEGEVEEKFIGETEKNLNVDLAVDQPEELTTKKSKDSKEKDTKKVALEDASPAAEIVDEKKVEEQPQITEDTLKPKKKGFFSRIFKKEQPTVEQQGVISRFKESFTKKTLSSEKFDELFWDLEVAMLENNVAVEVIEKIKADMKTTLTSGKVSRMGIEDLITLSLKKSIEEVLSIEGFDLIKKVREKKPFVIAMIGVNGTGKTTTLAKLANLFKNEGLEVVVAASDTFRAAAIDQLKEHTDKLGVKLISQGYGADPAAVAYDAVEHAKARGIDVVMIDTAGRLHSNTNLMAELEKVIRVAKPDLKIFIGESITGNDCVEQAKEFDKIAGIDAIILSKADVDEKGGAAISVSYVTKKPILYLGVGQAYGDLKKFDRQVLMRGMGL